MLSPVGKDVISLVQAASSACLITNTGPSAIFCNTSRSVSSTNYAFIIDPGASLPWPGADALYGVCDPALAPSTFSVVNTTVAPGATARSIYATGTRLVDAPVTTSKSFTRNSDLILDVSQALSADISLSATFSLLDHSAGRLWARFALQWFDASGVIITQDDYEVGSMGVGFPWNGASRNGHIRTPCLGTSLRIVMLDSKYGSIVLGPNDTGLVGVTLSARTTDRTRYHPGNIGPNSGAPQGGWDGFLMRQQVPALAASSTSTRYISEVFSGTVDLSYTAQPGIIGVLYFGSAGDGISPLGFVLPAAAGGYNRISFQCPRTSFAIEFLNQNASSTAGPMVLALASDN